MGSRTFCMINMDGSWPVMSAGGDIKAYQDCLIMFKDAWAMSDAAAPDPVCDISNSSLKRMKQALVKNRAPRRQPNLARASRA